MVERMERALPARKGKVDEARARPNPRPPRRRPPEQYAALFKQKPGRSYIAGRPGFAFRADVRWKSFRFYALLGVLYARGEFTDLKRFFILGHSP
jgi:ADP-heptose:LPS heptosyltransferase